MSGTDPGDRPPPEMPAAEYVLGTLDAADAEAARARLAQDPAFAAEVRMWETRMLPLVAVVAPVPPPAGLWDRIERSTGGAPAVARRAVNDNRVRAWRAVALASMAVAAGLAAFIVWQPTRPVFAVLRPTGMTAPVLVGFGGAGAGIDLRFDGPPPAAETRDLQLWSLPAAASSPTSLGLLAAGGRRLPPGIAPGTRLLVSSEPKGGSPTGLPTGPVVYGGVVARLPQ